MGTLAGNVASLHGWFAAVALEIHHNLVWRQKNSCGTRWYNILRPSWPSLYGTQYTGFAMSMSCVVKRD